MATPAATAAAAPVHLYLPPLPVPVDAHKVLYDEIKKAFATSPVEAVRFMVQHAWIATNAGKSVTL
jgi:hypothetical protein